MIFFWQCANPPTKLKLLTAATWKETKRSVKNRTELILLDGNVSSQGFSLFYDLASVPAQNTGTHLQLDGPRPAKNSKFLNEDVYSCKQVSRYLK